MSQNKTTCPVSLAQFAARAKAVLPVAIDGIPMAASVKAPFSTNSFGWYGNAPVSLTLSDGTVVKCQVGVTITVVNSKEAPRE